MEFQCLNVDLLEKLALALAIIRNTPTGYPVDQFTRALAKRIFSSKMKNIDDEHLLLRQKDLISRLRPTLPFTSTSSLMDLSELNEEDQQSIIPRSFLNEYDYGDFAEKLCLLKDRSYSMKISDLEFFFAMMIKSLRRFDLDQPALPMDLCLYTMQLIVSRLEIDHDKPYHLIFDLLPLIERFLDVLFDQLEQTKEKNIDILQQMIGIWTSANPCISRLIDKLSQRLRQHCENSFIHEENDSIDRLFTVFHQLVHHRTHFQRRLSQQSIEKIYTLIHQLVTLLDGKLHYRHLLKLQGQLQAGNYFDPSERTRKSFRSYPSSSSSEHSQCQGTQSKFHLNKTIPPASLSNSQLSQSQYFSN